MRPATLGLLTLASLLAGATPGSNAVDHPTLHPPAPQVQTDTHRLMELTTWRARRDDQGVIRLSETRIEPRPIPFQGLDTAALHQVLTSYPNLLGPASIGKPTHGALLNGRQLSPSPLWEIHGPDRAWGTPELISCLERSVAAVHDQFPNSPPLHIGDLSRREGGHLRGHVSHQSGLDADIGFYYRGESAWYLKATEKNLDRERTWALVRALVTDCDVQYLFLDFLVLVLLRDHAEKIGESPEWIGWLFAKGPRKPGVIRHAWGHRTHIHVRVFDEQARALGERVQEARLWGKTRSSGRP